MKNDPDNGNPAGPRKPAVLDTGAELLSVASGPDGQERAVRSTAPQVLRDDCQALTAGLIDLQVNGFNGIDFNNEHINAADVDSALAAILASGVTTCLPTIITASSSQLRQRLLTLDKAVSGSRLGSRMVPGYHLEGPFLNAQPGYAGCHPATEMLTPSIDLVRSLEQDLERPILYLTVAPELDHALDLIAWAADRGKIVGVGHSAASQEELSRGVEAGLRVSTHLGNGVAATLAKFDNPVLNQLSDDRLFGCFIADGIHIPARILQSFIRAKGIHRSILVTDAIAAASAPAGTYALAGMPVESASDGRVNVKGCSMLAGSSLRMDSAIANICTWGIADFRSALRMSCANPQALLASALQAHGMSISLGEIAWDENQRPLSVELGTCRWDGSKMQ